MNAYLMASISFLSGGSLDLTYIWEHQKVQQEVVNKVEQLIPLVWQHLTGGTFGSNQSSNVGEWSKRPELMQPETNADGSYLNETQQQRIKEAEAIEPNYWFGLANWAKSRNLLTPIERKAAFNFGTMKSRNRGITSLKQAVFALKIVEKAEELGYTGE